jgi:hypothetical protein
MNNKNTEKSKFQSNWENSPGVVYFIAAGRPHIAIKIGITTKETIQQRLRHIQSANHELIEILGLIVFENGHKPMLQAEAKEKELHNKFKNLQRFKPGWVGSEWFTVNKELIEYIKNHTVSPEELGITSITGKPKYLEDTAHS